MARARPAVRTARSTSARQSLKKEVVVFVKAGEGGTAGIARQAAKHHVACYMHGAVLSTDFATGGQGVRAPSYHKTKANGSKRSWDLPACVDQGGAGCVAHSPVTAPGVSV